MGLAKPELIILLMIAEGKLDETPRKFIREVGLHDRYAVGVEIPVFWLIKRLPVHLNRPPIRCGLCDCTDCLDLHTGDMLVLVLKGQAVYSHEGGFDCDAISGLHPRHVLSKFVVVAVLPDAFTVEAFRLVVSIPNRADKPEAPAWIIEEIPYFNF